MNYTQQSAVNRPTQDNYEVLNFKMKPEDRRAFRLKCLEMNIRMSDVLRNSVVAFLRDELRC